jgi:glycosyltransferase involved in cell wall biosynthesis
MSFRPMVTHRHIHNLRQKCPGAKIVYNTVDLHFLRLDREANLKNDPGIAEEGQKMKEIELKLMKQADLTTVVSSAELETLQRTGIERLAHLPFSRRVSPTNIPFELRSGLIFVGGFQHTPNVDAVKYLVDEVMPAIRTMIPGVELNIVGSNVPEDVLALSGPDILVHGYVEDLDTLIGKMRINVAPLRYGAGTKGKVAHALANGLPTVATSIAVEGMGLTNMHNVAVADSIIAFAEMVKLIYTNRKVWDGLSRNGYYYAIESFSVSKLKENLHSILSVLM